MDDLIRVIKLHWGLYLPFALLLVLGAVYSAYWVSLSREIEANVGEWADRQRALGYNVQYKDLRVGGFPFRIDIHMNNFVLGDSTHANAWSWSIEELVAITLPYRLNQILVNANGNQSLEYQESAKAQSRSPRQFRIDSSTESWRASLVFSDGATERLAIDVEGLAAQRSSAKQKPENIKADHLQLHAQFQLDAEGKSKVYAVTQNLKLPARKVFETVNGLIEFAELEVTLDELIEILSSRDAFKAWIDRGGVIDVSKLRVRWDGIDVSGDGTIGFDDQVRPTGRINMLVGGHDRFVDKLLEARVINQSNAGIIRSALTLLAIAGGDPQGRVRTQIKIENGEIFVGPAKLGGVTPIQLD